MARYGRRRKKRQWPWGLMVVAVLAVVVWRMLPSEPEAPPRADTLARAEQPTLVTDRPEDPPSSVAQPDVVEKGSNVPADSVKAEDGQTSRAKAASLQAAGKTALARGDLIAARTHLSEALLLGLDKGDGAAVRAELARIATKTILSAEATDGDPLVDVYTIQPGDTLGKIAKKYKVSDDLLARVNNIQNKNMIRAGWRLKTVVGPFRAVVDKKAHRLDVYLGNTFVKQYPVGLGEHSSTPTGEWQVGTKLKNPTYYPPRSGKIIAADDPENPLGERWIGLIGTKGAALGQHRYGVHGTIEPESIGKDASLGCIRMFNEDVEELYDMLIEKHSTVTVE